MTGILLALRQRFGFGGGFSGGRGGFAGGDSRDGGFPEGDFGTTITTTTHATATATTPAAQNTPAPTSPVADAAAPVAPVSTPPPKHTTGSGSSPPSNNNFASKISSKLSAASQPSPSSSRSTGTIKPSSTRSTSSSLPTSSTSSPSVTPIPVSASPHTKSNHKAAIAGALVSILVLLLLLASAFLLLRRRRRRRTSQSDVEKRRRMHNLPAQSASESDSKSLPPLPTTAIEGDAWDPDDGHESDSSSSVDEKALGRDEDLDSELPLPSSLPPGTPSAFPIPAEPAPSFHTVDASADSDETLPGYARPLPPVPRQVRTVVGEFDVKEPGLQS